MKLVDFAVEGMLDGEDAKLFTKTETNRERTYELSIRGKRYILSLRKTRKDGPHDHNATRDRL